MPSKAIGDCDYDLTLCCDASMQGYGCKLGEETAGSRWSSDDLEQHFTNINTREFLAVLYALQSFSAWFTGKVVMVGSDDSTAVSFVNEYGGMKSDV